MCNHDIRLCFAFASGIFSKEIPFAPMERTLFCRLVVEQFITGRKPADISSNRYVNSTAGPRSHWNDAATLWPYLGRPMIGEWNE